MSGWKARPTKLFRGKRMPFLLMLFLLLVCMPEPRDWHSPIWFWRDATPMTCLLWTALAAAIPVLYAGFLGRSVTATLKHRLADRFEMSRRYERGRFRHQLAVFAFFTLSLYVFGWGWAVDQAWNWGG